MKRFISMVIDPWGKESRINIEKDVLKSPILMDFKTFVTYTINCNREGS